MNTYDILVAALNDPRSFLRLTCCGESSAQAIESFQSGMSSCYVVTYSENGGPTRMNLSHCHAQVVVSPEDVSGVALVYISALMLNASPEKSIDFELLGFPMSMDDGEAGAGDDLIQGNLDRMAEACARQLGIKATRNKNGWSAGKLRSSGASEATDCVQTHSDRSTAILHSVLRQAFQGKVPVILPLWHYEQSRLGRMTELY